MALQQLTSGDISNSAITIQNIDSSATQLFGMRNRLINGGMVIDQRNSGASVTPSTSGVYVLDRFYLFNTQASKFSIQQNAGSVTPPAGFTNYSGITSTSAFTPAAGDYFGYAQFIEGFNIADLAWGTANAATVTLSFWVRSSLTGTFGGFLKNSASTRFYTYSYTISAANTWEYKTITILGDTSGTWLTTNGIGIGVTWGLGAGSTYTGGSASWGGTFYNQPTGSQNIVSTNGATFYITGVQLEKGSVATPFDYRPYGTELALCQRYYQQLASGGDFTSFSSGQCNNSTEAFFYNQLFVPMRSSPSITPSSVSSFKIYSGATNVTVSSFVNRVGGAVSGGNYTTINFDCTVASGLTASYGATLMNATSSLPYISFSSEL